MEEKEVKALHIKYSWILHKGFAITLVPFVTVPRKVLKDVYDSATEPDEPDQMELDGNMDPDELYDDDQFYRENEAIPPAPKLQGDHSRPRGTATPANNSSTVPASPVPTTVEAPYQRRDENLEGKRVNVLVLVRCGCLD